MKPDKAFARSIRTSHALGVVFLAIVLASSAQAQDAALRDRVLQLVERLESPKPETRDASQASLIKLGAKVLPLLPEASKSTKPETARRLAEIRGAIGKLEEEINVKASRITIEGKGIRLSEAIQQLQKQSKNMVTDLRDPDGAGTTNPALDLDIRDRTFFEALDVVARKAGVSINFATGDGSVGIMEGPPMSSGLKESAGPFLVTLTRIGLFRDFQSGLSTATVQLDVSWEPRLRPMLLALKADELEVVDDRGKPVPPQIDKESTEVVLRPESPIAEVNLTLAAPDRSAKKLASFKLKADVTIPSGIKAFRFPSLAGEDVSQSIGDVRVDFKNTEVEENVWKVYVELVYPGEGPVFESYRQGLFNNRIWLQRPDGSKFEHNGGFSNTNAEGGKLGFEYVFVDVPGKPADYQLVYETPSKVVTIPVEVQFKDVDLP
jgi:hypothetical protein